jgi:hypothetical protein
VRPRAGTGADRHTVFILRVRRANGVVGTLRGVCSRPFGRRRTARCARQPHALPVKRE